MSSHLTGRFFVFQRGFLVGPQSVCLGAFGFSFLNCPFPSQLDLRSRVWGQDPLFFFYLISAVRSGKNTGMSLFYDFKVTRTNYI